MNVVHCKRSAYDVYIGRPSIFGNLWSHLDGTQAEFKVSCRAEAIENYELWLRGEKFTKVFPERRDKILRQLPALRGKTLGCWCKPKACHGDVLVRMVNECEV